MTRAAVFLDRDGILNHATVINNKPFSPRAIDEVRIIDGVVSRLESLKKIGYLLIGITNQPDVARKLMRLEDGIQINDFVVEQCKLDRLYCCFHDDVDCCNCRKPKPGLIYEAVRDYRLDINASYLIGDRWRDIETANAVNLRSYFVDYGYDESRSQYATLTFPHPTLALDHIIQSHCQ